jgi:hypothetical protein
MMELNKRFPEILSAYVRDMDCLIPNNVCNELTKFVSGLELELTTAQEEINHLMDAFVQYETICEKGELKASVLNLLKERDTAQEENKRLLSALISMCEQYIQNEDGTLFHMFMSAGEEATELLEDMGYLTCDNRENYSWTDKRQSALNGGK